MSSEILRCLSEEAATSEVSQNPKRVIIQQLLTESNSQSKACDSHLRRNPPVLVLPAQAHAASTTRRCGWHRTLCARFAAICICSPGLCLSHGFSRDS